MSSPSGSNPPTASKSTKSGKTKDQEKEQNEEVQRVLKDEEFRLKALERELNRVAQEKYNQLLLQKQKMEDDMKAANATLLARDDELSRKMIEMEARFKRLEEM